MRQMPDEEDKMPSFVVVGATGSPCGHTSEPNPVLDDVVKLAVGRVLGLFQARIRHSRVEILAHLGFSAAIVCMATRAMIGEMATRFHQCPRSGFHWVCRQARRLGN